MSTKFTPNAPIFRSQGHATTAAAPFAEGVNQVALDAEVFLDPTDLGAYVLFWVSAEETGDDWKGPYRVAPSGAAFPSTMLPLASAGPNGHPVFTTGVIDLGGYVGVVRWRAQIVVGNQDVAAAPRIYDVRVRKTQSVADNENPPRYYWMRNDVPDETNSLSIDDDRSVNFDAATSASQHELVVSAAADPATVQSDVRHVVNPSDLLRLDVNYLDASGYNAKTTEEILASFNKAPAGSAPVTTFGLGDAILLASTVTCQGANGALWMRKMTSGAWQGLGDDFDVTFGFDSSFGAAPEAIGYGAQKTGVFLYSAAALDNPWDGAVNNYVKFYVSDDGLCHLETQINNEGFKAVSVPRMDNNAYSSAKGSLRLLRNAGVVSAFLRAETGNSPNVNAGAVLVGQFELSENLHLSYFTDGATNGSQTTHKLSLTDSVKGLVPAGLRFFVSNDDGYAWKPATPGISVFMGETGQNLRWRADIDANQGSLDLRNLTLGAWAYRQASFGTIDGVTQTMRDQALADGGGSFTSYLYWQTIDKDQTLILMEDVLRESTPTEALLAKIDIVLDASAKVLAQRVTNYKNKVYLSAQGTLLHETYVLESDVDASGFLVETRCKVVGVSDQTRSGRYDLAIEQPLDPEGLPVDGKVTVSWNGTYHLEGGSNSFTWADIQGKTISIDGLDAGTLTLEVAPDMPSSLPRVDVVRIIDSRPGTDGIQEQVWLDWSRRPTVVTVFDGHPESVPVASSIGHEGFTANKRGGFVLPDGKRMAGFWRAETQW